MVAKASCGGREAPVCSSGQFCFNEACLVQTLKGESIDPHVITYEMKDPFPGLWTSRARSIQRKLESIGSQWSGGWNWTRKWDQLRQSWDSASLVPYHFKPLESFKCFRLCFKNGCCLVALVSFSRKNTQNILYLSRGLWNWSLRRQNGYQVPIVLSYPAIRVGIIWQHLRGKPVWADCVAPSHEAMRKVSCRSLLLRWSRCQGAKVTHWLIEGWLHKWRST